jgi:hypothetical protein
MLNRAERIRQTTIIIFILLPVIKIERMIKNQNQEKQKLLKIWLIPL